MKLTQKEKEQLKESVALGISLLDKNIPKWRYKIRTHIAKTKCPIRMSSCFNCVLGKLFGYYQKGIVFFVKNNLLSGRCMSDYGFAYRYDHATEIHPSVNRHLSSLWTKEVYRYVRTHS